MPCAGESYMHFALFGRCRCGILIVGVMHVSGVSDVAFLRRLESVCVAWVLLVRSYQGLVKHDLVSAMSRVGESCSIVASWRC